MSQLVEQQVVDRYRRRTPRSAEQHRRAKAVLPGGDSRTIAFFEPYPLYVASGCGQRLTDVDGNEYVDFLGNYTSMVHGHGHPEVARAVAEQAGAGTGFAAYTPAQVALAEQLCRRVTSIEQVRFCSTGTEATMNALRVARAFTARQKVVKVEGGYHGSHDLVEISVAPAVQTAGPAAAPRAVAEEPGIPEAVVDDVVVIPFNDAVAAAAAFEEHGHAVAAVIVEPVLGASGAIPSEDGYLQALRSLCDRAGALLIFDEVMTFRLHEGGAQGLYGVRPDLTTLGKIVGGGLPAAAFGGRRDVMALFAPPNPRMVQSGTFNANPLSMVAGLAALRLLTGAEIARINGLGESLARGLRDALDRADVTAQVTGVGSLRAVHFTEQRVRDYRSRATASGDVSRVLHLALLNRGVFIAPRGMLVVSTAMDQADIQACVAAFHDALREMRPYIADLVPHLLRDPVR